MPRQASQRPLVVRRYGDIDLARGMRVVGGVYGDIEVIARFRDKRKSKCFPRDASLIERLAWQHGMVEQLRLGTLAPKRRAKALEVTPTTLAEDIDRYLLSLEGTRHDRAETWLRYWRQWYGHQQRSELTLQQCQAFFEHVAPRKGTRFSASAKNKLRTYLLNVWRYHDGRRHSCPVLDIPVLADDAKPTRELPPAEITALLASMDDTAHRARLGLLFVTGCRPVELTTLTAEMFHLDEAVPFVRIATAKGGKPRIVPLPPFGVAYARDFIRHQGWQGLMDWRLRAAMRTAAKKAGLTHPARITPYALRHTYAMQLRRAGAGLDDIADALGHHSLETTRRYAQAVPERAAEVAGKMWGRLGL